MADVQFEENQFTARPLTSAPKGSGLFGLAVRLGLAKDEKSAETTLIVLAIIIALAAVGVFMLSGGSNPPPKVTPPDPSSYGR